MTRLVLLPAYRLPESQTKNSLRRFLLKFQNSLPTELAVNKGDVVVQVGTPWPQTLHRYRKAIGDNGTLVIIEAMSDNYEKLTAASKAKGYTNVHIIQAAAWSHDKEGVLLVSEHAGDHKIPQEGVLMDNDLREANQSMVEISVQFHAIDTVLERLKLSKINYLSVTVNGAELEVLKGASRTLDGSDVCRVYSKAHAKLADGTPLHVPILQFLENAGFTALRTRGEASSTKDPSWLLRDGDVYGWK